MAKKNISGRARELLSKIYSLSRGVRLNLPMALAMGGRIGVHLSACFFWCILFALKICKEVMAKYLVAVRYDHRVGSVKWNENLGNRALVLP